MSKYAIGLDFGSLSCRGILVDVQTGKTIASETMNYPHAVMDSVMPDGTPLPSSWALQHPQDFTNAMAYILSHLTCSVEKTDIIGIGLDCTASTVLPVYEDGTPLCMTDAFSSDPYAYIMMWKHHGGQPYADLMNRVARERQEPWLDSCGGIINSEWFFPKLMQLCVEAPHIYDAAAYEVEMADWLVWQLTGKLTRSEGCLGYKCFWQNGEFPSDDFFSALHPRMHGCIEKMLKGPAVALGACAGRVSKEAAARFSLPAGISVATANIDSHVCISASGITEPGKVLGIIGTSSVYIVMDHNKHNTPGIFGMVENGLLPGYIGYEAGQSCAGDCFAWFCKNCVPAAVKAEAELQNIPLQSYLTNLAEKLHPGESGLIALDWFNGNRSILSDSNLTGMILGMTVHTKPEEIYRALLESVVFGAKVIIENFRAHGVQMDTFYATGGIPAKNPLLMQIFADVLDMKVHIVPADQGGALGSAIMAVSASDFYHSVYDAIRAMSPLSEKEYSPVPENVAIYQQLYTEFRKLHDYFGIKDGTMHKLRNLQTAYKEDFSK